MEQNFIYDFLYTPWAVSAHMDNGDIVVRDTENRILANFQCDAPPSLPSYAAQRNATLFSLAPQLLEALEDAVAAMEEDQDTGVDEGIYEDEPRPDIDKLKALIQKAKGI